jgi:copper chaperone CopZ
VSSVENTRVYQVEGMSCSHCQAAVERAVQSLAGVEEARVELASGRLTVRFASRPDDDAVRRAVEEAGYRVV